VTCNIAVSLASYFEGERGQAMEEKDLLVFVVEDQSLKWAGMTVADDSEECCDEGEFEVAVGYTDEETAGEILVLNVVAAD